jgi:hypothetical protein
MAGNPLPGPIPPLLALGEDMANGAHNHGAAISLKQNDETGIRSDLDPARAAFNAYSKSKDASVTLHSILRAADSTAYAFIKAASALLAQSLGEFWSTAWAPTGFPNHSTAVPSTQDERFTLCQSLADFYTANPSYEVTTPKLVITAVAAQACHDAIKTARTAVNDGNKDMGQKKIDCDDAVATLRVRMRGLITELQQLLDDNDPLWEAFGLTKPGSDSTPDVPTALVLTAGPPSNIQSNWSPSARADHFRVYKKVVGVDAAFVEVAGPTDPEYTFTGLPSGKTVDIQVTAVNSAGESAPSATVSIVVP